MVKKNSIFNILKTKKNQFFIGIFLACLVSFANFADSSLHIDSDTDRTEKILDIELEKDIEEKEKNSEFEKELIAVRYPEDCSILLSLKNRRLDIPYLSNFHDKVPTPPPDFI